MKKKAILINSITRNSIDILNFLDFSDSSYSIIVSPLLAGESTHFFGQHAEKVVHLPIYQEIKNDHLSETEDVDDTSNESEAEYSLDALVERLRKIELPAQFSASLRTTCEHLVASRLQKIIRLVNSLEAISKDYDISLFITSNECIFHERVMMEWCSKKSIPTLHVNHGLVLVMLRSGYQFQDSQYFAALSKHDIESVQQSWKKKERTYVETGMPSLDRYLLLRLRKGDLRKKLNIPEQAFLVTFFTTYGDPMPIHRTRHQNIYRETLLPMLDVAKMLLDQHPDLYFIIKDRNSNESFAAEEIEHIANKTNINKDRFIYIKDNPEQYVIDSDLTLACGSTIAAESLICEVPHISVHTPSADPYYYHPRQGIPCLAPDHELIHCISELIENPSAYRLLKDKQLADDSLIGESADGLSSLRVAALIAEILGEDATQVKINQAMQAFSEWYQQDFLTGQDNFDSEHNPLLLHWQHIARTIEVGIVSLEKETRYQQWLNATKVDALTGQLAAERYLSWPRHPHVNVIIINQDNDHETLQTTLNSLDAQLYPAKHFSAFQVLSAPIVGDIKTPSIVCEDSIKSLLSSIFIDPDQLYTLVHAGDLLHPMALFYMAEAWVNKSDLLYVYADEDRLQKSTTQINEKVHLVDPVFKPDFSESYFLSYPFTGPSACLSGHLLQSMQAADSDFPVALLTELAVFHLLLNAAPDQIQHLPFVLFTRAPSTDYTWGSAAFNVLRGQLRSDYLAIKQDLMTEPQPFELQAGLFEGLFNVLYAQNPRLKTALLMQVASLDAELLTCLESLEKTDEVDYALHLATAEPEDLQGWLATHLPNLKAKIHPHPANWNSAMIWNGLLQATDEDQLVFLTPDNVVVQGNWLTHLLGQLAQPQVCAVAPRLTDAKGRIRSAGRVLGMNGLFDDVLQGFFLEQDNKDAPRAWASQEFSLLNPSGLAVNRQALPEQLDAKLYEQVAFADWLLRADGKKIWLAYATLIKQRPSDMSRSSEQVELFLQQHFMRYQSDPYHNHNLELRNSGHQVSLQPVTNWHPNYVQRSRLVFFHNSPSKEALVFANPIRLQCLKLVEDERIQSCLIERDQFAKQDSLHLFDWLRLRLHHLVVVGVPGDLPNDLKMLKQYTDLKVHLILHSVDQFDSWKEYLSLVDYCIYPVELYDSMTETNFSDCSLERIVIQADAADLGLGDWLQALIMVL